MKTLSLLFLLPILACATPYARQWESRLWLTPTTTKADKPEIGTLGTDELAVAVVCTQFRQVLNPSNSVLAIAVQCRNTTDSTHVLDYNPIQVLSDSNLVVQPLPLDHVMYKFYGGDLRNAGQLDQLARPYADYTGDAFVDILIGLVNVYRSYEENAIITEFARKEALPHDLYYRSFTPTSLPPGASVQWIQYYPGMFTPLKVMLEGYTVDTAVVFEKPPPAPPRTKTKKQTGESLVLMVMLAAVFFIGVIAFGADTPSPTR